MLSKEEIETCKEELLNYIEFMESAGDNAGWARGLKWYIEQLETDKQKLIEKLEERRKQNNNRYGQAIDNDEFPEMYEYSGQVQEDDYILEILKGEKK